MQTTGSHICPICESTRLPRSQPAQGKCFPFYSSWAAYSINSFPHSKTCLRDPIPCMRLAFWLLESFLWSLKLIPNNSSSVALFKQTWNLLAQTGTVIERRHWTVCFTLSALISSDGFLSCSWDSMALQLAFVSREHFLFMTHLILLLNCFIFWEFLMALPSIYNKLHINRSK